MDVQTYNVAALDGLNIRSIMSLFGDILYRDQYNDEVAIITDGFRLPAVIDNLVGSWVAVDDNRGGFIFDGYLVPNRMPHKTESISDYATSLGLTAEKHETDLEIKESFISPDITVQQAFLIARVLFNMSPKLELPTIVNEHNVISEVLPNGSVWEEQISVSRDRWELTGIDYTRFYEGGAMTGSIVLAGEDGLGAEIMMRAIAD